MATTPGSSPIAPSVLKQSDSATKSTPQKPQRGPPPGEKKVLTKAERREIQERQRAEKEALKTQPGGKAAPPRSKPQQQQQQQQQQQPAAPAPRRQAIPPPKEEPSRAGTTAPSEFGGTETMRIFSHFALPKPIATLGTGIKGDIHPTIRRLGLQFADFRIVGANARCIATLTAFKTVIQDYVTPSGTTLSRHLMTYLSPQISYLVAARPMSISTGNAIRYLKYEISILSIDLPEQDAKNFLCERIDSFIRERIILADQVIQATAMEKIHSEDTVLVYARSSVVEKTILGAWEAGRRFSVVIIDSRPLSEGRALLASLTSANIPCTYALLSSLPAILPTITTILLGAHALHSNGSLYSRAGTALVAMMAKAQKVPVVVCCETYKFSDAILLDSFMKNEIAPNEISASSSAVTAERNLQILSPLYDLTPPTNITAVVTEVGLIPATAVPTVLARGHQGSM